MSNDVNTRLIERAIELAEEVAGHPAGLDKTLLQLIEAKELDELYAFVSKVEAQLSQEHFYSTGIF